MATLSLDIRQRILKAYDRGGATREQVARRFEVSLGMVKKLIQQRRHCGDISPRHHRSGRKPLILDSHRRQMRLLLGKQPDLTLEEIRGRLGLGCTVQAIHHVLADMDMTYKKRRSTLRSNPVRMQPAPAGSGARSRGGVVPSRLVFLDESAAKTNMTRLRGRCLRGKRLHASAPCGRWSTTTMIGSVRQDGGTACMTVEGAVNAEVFRSRVREILLPTHNSGDILVMDNLSAHKGREALVLLKNAGVTVRFLPAYSPDPNPIELMWSKVKALLRKAEAPTNDALLLAIGEALSMVTRKDATHWFAHCGYIFI